MRRLGTKKISTKVAGHQACGTCHPGQKSRKARSRQEAGAEIVGQLVEAEEAAIDAVYPECSTMCSMCNPAVDTVNVPAWLAVDLIR